VTDSNFHGFSSSLSCLRRVLLLFFVPFLSYAQHSVFTGQVFSPAGQPLSGVNVILNRTGAAAVTDSAGRFLISRLVAGPYTAVLSYTGFETLETRITVPVNGTHKQDFILVPASRELGELTVTSARQSKMMEAKTLAIKSVEMKDVAHQSTVLGDVADRLSGIRIRRSGSMGDRSDISINGITGSGVRIYIDGIPMEIAYPAYDLSTLPLNTVKRMDVYKGVVPVDIGTDAMGGAINIITEQKANNHLRASYYTGSFNTHMADLNLGLANKNQWFFNISGSYNYSDNDYSMRAFVFENNQYETIKRFHDAYQASFASVNFGTHSKKWADELRFFFNYSKGFKEVQNWARVTTTALGEAGYKARNQSGGLRYEKGFLNEKVQFLTHLTLSNDNLHYTDTSRNVYSWSGKILKQDARGEYSYGLNDNRTVSTINRSTVHVHLTARHQLTLSNLYAFQRRTGTNHLVDNPQRDYLRYPQTLEKNISGLQYEGIFGEKVTLTTGLKRYFFDLHGVENSTFQPLNKKDSFFGYYLAGKYRINARFNTKASYERGYLIPDFEQFVGDGATILRNTNLKPENSHNLNLSAGYEGTGRFPVSANLNGFLRDQLDIIYAGTGIVRRYENQEKVRTLGAEADFSVKYMEWQLKGAYTRLSRVFRMLKDPLSNFLEGTLFPNHPSNFGNVELEWRKNRPGNDVLRAYVNYLYIGYYNHTLLGRNDTYKSRPELFVPTQNRVDSGVSYKLARYHVTAAFNVHNIFDKALFDNFSVPKPGRSVNLRITYEINNF